MTRNNRPIVIGAVLLGVLALALTLYSVLGGRGGTPTPPPGGVAPPAPRITQLRAKQSIPPRTRITPEMAGMFEEEEVAAPADGAPANDFASFEDIQGRLVTEPIYPGRPIPRTALTEAVGRVTPANFEVQDNVLPANSRAIAVMVDPNATMGGLVDVGDRVDVIVVHALKYRSTSTGLEGNARSGRTIGQNLLVLATDAALKKAQAPPAGAAVPGAAPGAAPPPPPPPPPPANPNAPTAKVRVVLAAPPAIAERIVAAQEQGNIHLSLRPPSSPEQFPVPEAVEYPVRPGPDPAAVTRAERLRTEAREDRRAALTAARDERNQRAAREALRDAARAGAGSGTSVRIPDPTTPFRLPTTDSTPPPPAPPAGSEITVIRGTEKTRVLVPSR